MLRWLTLDQVALIAAGLLAIVVMALCHSAAGRVVVESAGLPAAVLLQARGAELEVIARLYRAEVLLDLWLLLVRTSTGVAVA